MDTLSYAAFSASFHRNLSERRLPLNGTIEVTQPLPADVPPLLQQPADGGYGEP